MYQDEFLSLFGKENDFLNEIDLAVDGRTADQPISDMANSTPPSTNSNSPISSTPAAISEMSLLEPDVKTTQESCPLNDTCSLVEKPGQTMVSTGSAFGYYSSGSKNQPGLLLSSTANANHEGFNDWPGIIPETSFGEQNRKQVQNASPVHSFVNGNEKKEQDLSQDYVFGKSNDQQGSDVSPKGVSLKQNVINREGTSLENVHHGLVINHGSSFEAAVYALRQEDRRAPPSDVLKSQQTQSVFRGNLYMDPNRQQEPGINIGNLLLKNFPLTPTGQHAQHISREMSSYEMPKESEKTLKQLTPEQKAKDEKRKESNRRSAKKRRDTQKETIKSLKLKIEEMERGQQWMEKCIKTLQAQNKTLARILHGHICKPR